jgi:hypothetical protein
MERLVRYSSRPSSSYNGSGNGSHHNSGNSNRHGNQSTANKADAITAIKPTRSIPQGLLTPPRSALPTRGSKYDADFVTRLHARSPLRGDRHSSSGSRPDTNRGPGNFAPNERSAPYAHTTQTDGPPDSVPATTPGEQRPHEPRYNTSRRVTCA